jgi:NAD(P)H-dependent FMN reductase
MTSEKVVILDGTAGIDPAEARIAATVRDVIGRASRAVDTFTLRDERIAHCIGCFGCWLETPGLCRSADRGRDIVQAMIQADTVVLVTPVTFGGYSSQLKRLVDKWIQVVLPFFEKYEGELHHPLRYGRFPRLVAVGIQATPDGTEATLFRALVARNALNFRAPSHAVEVVGTNETDDVLRVRLAAVLTRHDAMPTWESIRGLVPIPSTVPDAETPAEGRKALVLVGSPKTKKPSTSGVLGHHLLTRLAARGWQGEVLTITAAIRDEAWRERMLTAVDAADLLVLAFPLYIDALPVLLTRALEVIRERRRTRGPARAQRLVALVNSGFPEAHHSLPALAICARFASAAGMTWAGGLAMGAGEALSSGVPLTGPAPNRARPPVGHVIAALELAAAELADGRPVPSPAATLIARIPFPLLPFSAWRRLFAFMGGRNWRRESAGNGLGPADLLARPFLAERSNPVTRAR